MILGLSSIGIDGYSAFKWSKDVKQIARELHFEKDNMKLNKIKARMLSKDEKCGIKDFKRCFTLYMLGALLCPTSFEVKSSYLVLVRDVSTINRINWSKLILQELMIATRLCFEGKNKGLRGCILFLMVREISISFMLFIYI